MGKRQSWLSELPGWAARWIAMLLITAVALVLCSVLRVPLDGLAEIVAQTTFKWLAPVRILAVAGAAGLVWFCLPCRLRGGVVPALKSGTLLRRPPAALFGLLGAVIYLVASPALFAVDPLCDSRHGLWDVEPWVFDAPCLVVGIASAAWVFSLRQRRLSRHRPPGERDAPISSPDQDKFERQYVARRIAESLSSGTPFSVGLVGPYGAGKTSVINMAECYAREHQTTKRAGRSENAPEFIRIGGWGLREGSAAEYILGMAVDGLSQRTDCLELVAMPSHYMAAVSASGNACAGILLSILGARGSPETAIARLDKVAGDVGVRLVLCLEDLDRNQADARLWDEVDALLDRLHQCTHVTFVLAVAAHPDLLAVLQRNCDRLESLPPLQPLDVARTMLSLRSDCLGSVPGDTVLLVGRESNHVHASQEKLIANTEMTPLESPMSLGYGKGALRSPVDAIARLLVTPRVLRMVREHVSSPWARLRGEIDFDDLLVCTVLRFAAPEAHAFVLANIEGLRRTPATKADGENATDQVRAALDADWEHATAKVTWDIDAANMLVGFLLPAWITGSGMGASRSPRQGVAVHSPTDYWARYLAGDIADAQHADQAVLRDLRAVNDEENTGGTAARIAGSMLNDELYARQVEHFGGGLQRDVIRRIAQALFAAVLQRDGNRAAHRGGPDSTRTTSGYGELLRLSLAKEDWDASWVAVEVEAALRTSLRFAVDLLHDWVFNHPRVPPGVAVEIWCGAVRCAQRLYDNPNCLGNVLPRDFPYSCYHFAVLLPREGAGTGGFHPEEWHWLRDPLFRVAHAQPSIGIPQLVGLVLGHDGGDLTPHLDEEVLWGLIGSRTDELAELLSLEFDDSAFSARYRSLFAHARAAAMLARLRAGKKPVVNSAHVPKQPGGGADGKPAPN